MEIIREASKLLKRIKENRPLVHHITNYVTMNDSANAVLAIGGSPIMANDPAEASEVTSMAKALVLNMGTPNSNSFKAMLLAGKRANELKMPIVFDPVGIGATAFRREMCNKLLEQVRPTVIKGNISEIMQLAGMAARSGGVDAIEDCSNGAEAVQRLSRNLDCIVAATGRTDIVSDRSITYFLHNGHELLPRITGTGCMTSSMIAAFCSVARDNLVGTVGGIMTMGISGQLAYKSLQPDDGIGTFKVRLFDNIYNLNEETFIREGVAHAG